MSLYAEVIEEITGDGRWVGFHPPSVTGLWKTSKASFGYSVRQDAGEGAVLQQHLTETFKDEIIVIHESSKAYPIQSIRNKS
ncbi:hypothetical protein E5288_WYG007207 [Bos mutus]|uniref:Uncharacterized protein n=1 Tax=Bos mutus TaxID=72004 RepID=A0A6B0QPK0_9CETA|nr:hypothetical protein [Bos mutus]